MQGPLLEALPAWMNLRTQREGGGVAGGGPSKPRDGQQFIDKYQESLMNIMPNKMHNRMHQLGEGEIVIWTGDREEHG